MPLHTKLISNNGNLLNALIESFVKCYNCCVTAVWELNNIMLIDLTEKRLSSFWCSPQFIILVRPNLAQPNYALYSFDITLLN